MDGQQRSQHGLGQPTARVPGVVPGAGPSSPVTALDSLRRPVGDGRQTVATQGALRRPQTPPSTYPSQGRRLPYGGRPGQLTNMDSYTTYYQGRGGGGVQNTSGLLPNYSKEPPKPKQVVHSEGVSFSGSPPQAVGRGPGPQVVLSSYHENNVSRPGVSHGQVEAVSFGAVRGNTARVDRMHQNNMHVKPPGGAFVIGASSHQVHGDNEVVQARHPAHRSRVQIPITFRGNALQAVPKGRTVGEAKAQGEQVRIVPQGSGRGGVLPAQNVILVQPNQAGAGPYKKMFVLADEKGNLQGLMEGDTVTGQLSTSQGFRISGFSSGGFPVGTNGGNIGDPVRLDMNGGNRSIIQGPPKQVGSRSMLKSAPAYVRVPQEQVHQQSQGFTHAQFPKTANMARRMPDQPNLDQISFVLEPQVPNRAAAQVHKQAPSEAVWRSRMNPSEKTAIPSLGNVGIRQVPGKCLSSSRMDTDVMAAAESLQGLSTGGSVQKKMRMTGDDDRANRKAQDDSDGSPNGDRVQTVGKFVGLDLLLDAATRAGDDVGRNTGRSKRPSRVRAEAGEPESPIAGKMPQFKHYSRQSMHGDVSEDDGHYPPPSSFQTHELYRGVTPTSSGKFIARCRYNGAAVKIGDFDCALDASKAYDRVILSLRGEEAIINHPRQEYLHFEILNAKRAFDMKVRQCKIRRQGSPQPWIRAAKWMLEEHTDVAKMTEILSNLKTGNPTGFQEALARLGLSNNGSSEDGAVNKAVAKISPPTNPLNLLHKLGEEGATLEEALSSITKQIQDQVRKSDRRRSNPDPYPYAAEILKAIIVISKRWDQREGPLMQNGKEDHTGCLENEDICQEGEGKEVGVREGSTDNDKSSELGNGHTDRRVQILEAKDGTTPNSPLSKLSPLLGNSSDCLQTDHVDVKATGKLALQSQLDGDDVSMENDGAPSDNLKHNLDGPMLINGNKIRGRRPAPRRGSGRVSGKDRAFRREAGERSGEVKDGRPDASGALDKGKRPRDISPCDPIRRKKQRVSGILFQGQGQSRGLKTGRVRRPSLGGLSRDRATEFDTSSMAYSSGEIVGDDCNNMDADVVESGKTGKVPVLLPEAGDVGSGVEGADRNRTTNKAAENSYQRKEDAMAANENAHEESPSSNIAEKSEEQASSLSRPRPQISDPTDQGREDSAHILQEMETECVRESDRAPEDGEEDDEKMINGSVHLEEESKGKKSGGSKGPKDEQELAVEMNGTVMSCNGDLADGSVSRFLGLQDEVEEGVIAVNGNQLVVQLEDDDEGDDRWEIASKMATPSLDLSEVTDVVRPGDAGESIVDSVRWLRLLASSLWPKKRGGGMMSRAFDRSFSGGRHRELMLDVRKRLFEEIDDDEH